MLENITWNMELCISVGCRFGHRAQLFLIMLQKSQQVWVCRLQGFDMKCRGALERRSGNIDLQELLVYRNRHISYSGGIHPQIWLLLSTCFRFLWRTALRECTSLHEPVRVLGRSQCFALLLGLCLTLSLLYLLAAALSLSASHSSSRPPTGSS